MTTEQTPDEFTLTCDCCNAYIMEGDFQTNCNLCEKLICCDCGISIEPENCDDNISTIHICIDCKTPDEFTLTCDCCNAYIMQGDFQSNCDLCEKLICCDCGISIEPENCDDNISTIHICIDCKDGMQECSCEFCDFTDIKDNGFDTACDICKKFSICENCYCEKEDKRYEKPEDEREDEYEGDYECGKCIEEKKNKK